VETKTIDWSKQFAAIHPRRLITGWRSASRPLRAIASLLLAAMVISVLYQNLVGGYEVLTLITPVLAYASICVLVWLAWLIALLCGMVLDRVGVLVLLQQIAGVIVGVVVVLLICGAISSMSTSVAVIVGAIIIAFAISNTRR
jgi:hypothetical protein